MLASPVSRLFLRVVLWLPVIFAAWYYMAIVATWPVTYLVEWLLTGLFPDVISGIQQNGYHVEAAAYYTVQSASTTAPKGMVAELVFEVNALAYGYCIPLYTALILATPSEEGEKWFRWTIGILLLQITQSWGVGFDILKSLLFDIGPEAAKSMAFEQWQKESVALGYQFGYLILPAVAPIAIWIAFHSDYLKVLAPNLSEAD